MNLDNQLNVLDVVTMVSYIVGTSNELTDEAFNLGDVNSDGALDVLDIVQIVNLIVNSEPMPDFSLLDFYV